MSGHARAGSTLPSSLTSLPGASSAGPPATGSIRNWRCWPYAGPSPCGAHPPGSFTTPIGAANTAPSSTRLSCERTACRSRCRARETASTTPWSRHSSRPSRPNSSGAPSSRAGSKPRSQSAVTSTASTILSAAIRRSTSSAPFSSKGGQRKIENALHKRRASPYAFDRWMDRNYPGIRFERYADDAIVHCRSKEEARSVLEAIRGRFAECGLELHPEKTRIVYCKEDDRPGSHEHIKFDFLGYTFQPRRAKNRWGKYFIGFLPAISNKAAKAIRQTIREWRMASTRNNQRLEDLARLTNPVVRGWMNYYGRFYRSKCVQVLRHLNEALGRWAQRKFKRFKRRERASMHWLGCIARRDPNLFVLWQLGVRPEAGV